MKNKREGMFSVRTLILILTLVVMVFSLFVVLPASLPSINDIDQDIFWACTYWGSAPEKYITWTWDTDEQPTQEEWMDVLYEGQYYLMQTCGAMMQPGYVGEPDRGILNHIHRTKPDKGFGKLHFEVDPENETRIIVSGYLQYGTMNTTSDDTIQILKNAYSSIEFPDMPADYDVTTIMYDLLEYSPYPTKKGVLRKQDIGISLFNRLPSGQSQEYFRATTDIHGYFSIVLEPHPDAVYYEVTVSNPDVVIAPKSRGDSLTTYLRNSVFYSNYFNCGAIEMPGRDEGKNRAWVFAGIVLAGGVFLLIWYLTHRKRKQMYEEVEDIEEMELDIGDTLETAPGGDTDRIEIVFPQIEPPLPDVWGVNDRLDIIFRLKDTEAKIIPATECLIDLKDSPFFKETSDIAGEISLSHTYTEKGEYHITGTCRDPETHHEVSSWRIIRIVDYREEMVRLFNRMLYTLDLDTVSIDNRMTAREVERILAPELEGIPDKILQTVVDGFEEANYSIHDISRESFTRMYMAVKEVIDFGKQQQKQTEDTEE